MNCYELLHQCAKSMDVEIRRYNLKAGRSDVMEKGTMIQLVHSQKNISIAESLKNAEVINWNVINSILTDELYMVVYVK